MVIFMLVMFGLMNSSLSDLVVLVNNRTTAFIDLWGIFIFSLIRVDAAAQTTVFITVTCSYDKDRPELYKDDTLLAISWFSRL